MWPTYKITADSKLNTILTTKFDDVHIEVGPNKVILPERYEKHQEKIHNFEVRDDDVYILGFPKSGCRWTTEMAWLLTHNLDFENARKVVTLERCLLLEMEILHDKFENYMQKINELESPRCIGSHLPWSLLPKSLTDGSKQPKMIVVLRAPEDTCVSFYYMSKTVMGYNGSFDEFCQLFLGGKVRYGPYWNQVLSCWNQRHRSNILFLKFYEMKTDLAGSIKKMAKFLGKDLSDEEVVAMCNYLTFDNMKTNEGFNMETMLKSRGCDMNPFVRTGIVGGHKEMMSEERIAEFKAQKELYLKGTGLNIE